MFRFIRPLFVALGLLLLALSGRAGAEATPSGSETPQGPEETLSPLRSRVVLNGVWRFQPAPGAGGEQPGEHEWGAMPVPGSWIQSSLPGLAAPGAGARWADVGENLSAAWYERRIDIPASWEGRAVVLDFRRLSTDASVTVDGRACGRVSWPYGEVDITAAVTPGRTATVTVRVLATADAGESLARMGYAVEKSVRNRLASAGLTGEVWLLSRPAGPRVTDVFVKPSVREKRVTLEVELADVARAGEVAFTARMLDEQGREEIVFTASAPVTAAASQTVSLAWPWPAPRLWDIDQPHLYRLVLEASGPGLTDAYAQRFGFRELRIVGRDFLLNEIPVRWRPAGGHGGPIILPEMDGVMRGLRRSGFNIMQIWPEDNFARGHANTWELLAERASELGMPVIAAATHFGRFQDDASGRNIWATPEGRAAYERVVRAELRRFRNEPSVMMYGTSANTMNHAADQNPRFIGQQKKMNAAVGAATLNNEALDVIRAADPLRPVFIHAGNRSGDVFTVNHYLNLIPLQEREEWFSEYATSGDVPYLGIEFGTPFNTNMNRGRLDFGNAHGSEPLLTEHTAAYVGPAAFALEPRDYRRNLRFGYNAAEKNWWGDWGTMQRIGSAPAAFQQFQALFVRNTWRSWRTWGVTGGMIPWNSDNQMWSAKSLAPVPNAPWTPGTRGPYKPTSSASYLDYLAPSAWNVFPAAQTLVEVNGPTLAWIAGAPAAFTEKAHHFRTGQRVEKQLALINDERTPQPFTATWRLTLGDQTLAENTLTGELAPAQNQLLPLAFTLPATLPADRADGNLTLNARIGAREHTDTFAFTVFAPAPVSLALPAKPYLFDPLGKTAALLAHLQIPTRPWKGRATKDAVLIVGREALSSHAELPGDLDAFAAAGGRILVMTQQPDYLRDYLGFRVHRFMSRRVFRSDSAHPVVAGLTDDNLRDWAASSTLLDPKPNYNVVAQFDFPRFGWRWGGRGAVTSAALEKPHHSGWRALLDAEFDLAYSPLLELERGAGRVTLCTLDLEDHAAADPAAEKLARQLLHHVATAPLPAPRAATTLVVGPASAHAALTATGLIVEHASTWPAKIPKNALLIVAPEARLPLDQALAAATDRGARILYLAAPAGTDDVLPLTLAKRFYGATTPPTAPVFAGLGRSDLRIRTEIDWRIFSPAPGVEADGLLFSRTAGPGLVVATRLDPAALDLSEIPALRFTRWRQTRALTQILANLGATFAGDARLFAPRLQSLPLAGEWRFQLTAPLPLRDWRKQESGHADPGVSPAALAAAAPAFDDSAWPLATLPGFHPELSTRSGEFFARRVVEIPADWKGEALTLGVGRIKSSDTVYWNGRPIGATVNEWNTARVYQIPAALVKPGRNVLATRGFAPDFQGGIHGSPDELFLRPAAPKAPPAALYHPDYRADFDYGDEPARYYRW